MTPRSVPAVEPFGERVSPVRNSLNGGTYRFGYRLELTKEVLSTVDIPADVVERALTAGLALSARMSPTGDVAPTLVGSGDAIAPNVVWVADSIERLVADAVDAGNVHLEEAVPKN